MPRQQFQGFACTLREGTLAYGPAFLFLLPSLRLVSCPNGCYKLRQVKVSAGSSFVDGKLREKSGARSAFTVLYCTVRYNKMAHLILDELRLVRIPSLRAEDHLRLDSSEQGRGSGTPRRLPNPFLGPADPMLTSVVHSHQGP